MKACPRLRFERTFVSTPPTADDVRKHRHGIEGFGIRAFEGQREVGAIFTRLDKRDAYVSWVEVDKASCRKGIATRLYEEAARAICEKYGKPLTSDTERSAATQSFWEKQVAKGRAECARPTTNARATAKSNETVEGRGGCLYYRLKSCDIASLGRRQRK